MIRKSSKQRDMIISYMEQMEGHITAEQLYEKMNASGMTISLATVYRNLSILEEMHKIKKVAHPVNGYVYDKTCKPHYHLHCIKCNELIDLPIEYMEEWNRVLEEKTGITVISHSLVAQGICPNCKK